MRKTLLIAGAALAASIISSQAQTVYSQNVVGYVNQTIPAGRYQIVGTQLITGSDVNATNCDANVALSQGLVSSPVPATVGNPTQNPALSTNSQLFYWSGLGFKTFYYFNAADATAWNGAPSTNGWYDAADDTIVVGGITVPDPAQYPGGSLNLNNGGAAFIFNNYSQPITVTTVGTVFQGTNVVTIHSGYNLISLLPPVGTNLLVDGNGNYIPYGLPSNMTSSNDVAAFNNTPTLTTQDSIYFWTGLGYAQSYYFTAADATAWENGYVSPATPGYLYYQAGFYDAAGDSVTNNGTGLNKPDPAYSPQTPAVNQGFFLYHNGSAIQWTNVFIVQ
jgi:hypothetical protein